jgi:hypothetical protein
MLWAAQRLSNGNYAFTSGRQGQAPNFIGQSIEVRPDGTKAYVLQVDRTLYRSFRVRTLYEGTNVPLRNAGEAALAATTPITRHSPTLAVARDLHVTERVTHPGNGSGTSAVPTGAFPDQVWSSVAAALTTSAKRPVSWTTPSSSAPTGVGMMLPRDGMWADELLAAGTREDGGLAISLAKHNPLSKADELWAAPVGTDGAIGDWPFLTVPKG